MSANQTATVAGPVLAKLLGVSEVQLGKLATGGILTRTGRNQFDLWKSVKGYIDHLQSRIRERKAPEHVKGLAAEKIRKTREEADRFAMENAVSKGRLVDVDAVMAGFGRCFSAMKDRILSCADLNDEDKDALLSDLRGILNREVLKDDGVSTSVPRAPEVSGGA